MRDRKQVNLDRRRGGEDLGVGEVGKPQTRYVMTPSHYLFSLGDLIEETLTGFLVELDSVSSGVVYMRKIKWNLSPCFPVLHFQSALRSNNASLVNSKQNPLIRPPF